MSFDKLIQKVTQAEDALEAHERRVAADLRQLKASWRTGWTPGRIVIAGLVGGFFMGRAEPLHVVVARGGGAMQLITMLSGLFAGDRALAAASGAEQAAASAEDVAAAIAPEALTPDAMSADYAARVAATKQTARSAAESFEP